jgi:hypothetical protein
LQLERTKRLVEKLRAYRDENAVPQVRLAAELNLSPANLSEILRGNNSPNSETTLHIIELIEPQFMRTIVDPPAAPRASTRDPSIPRTLSSALEKIDLLQSRIKQLEQPQHGTTAPIAPAKAHGIPPQGSVKIAEPKTRLAQLKAQSAAMPRKTGLVFNEPNLQDQAAPFNPSKLPGWERVQSPQPSPAKLLPASANTPYLVGEILKVTNFADLLSLLSNPAHSDMQKALIYAEVQSRRAITSDPE